jgi:hypothetical protein
MDSSESSLPCLTPIALERPPVLRHLSLSLLPSPLVIRELHRTPDQASCVLTPRTALKPRAVTGCLFVPEHNAW